MTIIALALFYLIKCVCLCIIRRESEVKAKKGTQLYWIIVYCCRCLPLRLWCPCSAPISRANRASIQGESAQQIPDPGHYQNDLPHNLINESEWMKERFRSVNTLRLDGSDDVICFEINFKPITRLMSGLLTRTPSAAVTFHANSVRENELNNY